MIKIFQINMDRDKDRAKFMPYRFLKEFDFSIYDEVWSGEVPSKYNSLEGIYEMFNLDHPDGFRGHSLSVSDIVQMEDEFYYCDSFGWKKIDIN